MLALRRHRAHCPVGRRLRRPTPSPCMQSCLHPCKRYVSSLAHSGGSGCPPSELEPQTEASQAFIGDAGPPPPAPSTSGRVREQKDPSNFKDMDELRDYLHARDGNPNAITIARIIDFLGKAITGANPGAALTPTVSASSPLELLRAGLVRGLAKAYRDLARAAGTAIRHRLSSGRWNEGDDESKWPQVGEEQYRELEPLMGGLLSMRSLRKAAYRHPPLLSMAPTELAVRLVQLKQLLGFCDVALLVEREPALFLGQDQQQVVQSVQRGLDLLQGSLAGADIGQVIERDPALLFLPELEKGLTEMRDLWDVDEEALRNSDPQMLALAVRALSVSGLPEGI